MLGLSFVNTVMEGTANMMDKHQNFICHVTPIHNVKMVICTYFMQVRVNKRTALRGGGGGGTFTFLKVLVRPNWFSNLSEP